jgi:hypothetical protein
MKWPHPWYKHWFNQDEIRMLVTVLGIFLLGAVVKGCRDAPELRSVPRAERVQELPQESVLGVAPDEE